MDFAVGTRRFQLCTIEPTIDLISCEKNVQGALVLSRLDDTFILSWSQISNSPMHHLTTLQQQPQSNEEENSWEPGYTFKQECGHIKLLQLHNDYSISLYGYGPNEHRKFQYEKSEFISVTELVEHLLINGIAVPSATSKYSLQFYKRCHRGVYPYTPPHIQLGFDIPNENEIGFTEQTKSFNNNNKNDNQNEQFSKHLQEFWDCLHTFFLKLITHLNDSDTLPKDPQFPLAESARANHLRVLEKIENFIQKDIGKFERIHREEWNDLFDFEGRLKDFENVKLRLFHSGIDSEILSEILPFVFGVYPFDSTKEEREQIKQSFKKEYEQIKEQVNGLKPIQIENNKRISSAFRVIRHDVSRTDRQLLAFRNDQGEGLKMITELLKSYCIFNPPIGYLQGMNDLFVPILLAYLPDWNEESSPINHDGKPIDQNETEDYCSIIFWCFDFMLRNIDHLKLLANVTEQCKKLSEVIFQIINKVSPLAAIWMNRNSLRELLWLYSDFVLLFKRSFPDIWSVWLQLNCSPSPDMWLAYFVAAILIQGFDELAQITEVNITTMMDKFPKIMSKISIDKIGKTSLWLVQEVPITKPKQEEKTEDIKKFKFFETSWTGQSQTVLKNKN